MGKDLQDLKSANGITKEVDNQCLNNFAMKEEFVKEFNMLSENNLTRCNLITAIANKRVLDLLFEEYVHNLGVSQCETYRILEAVEGLDNYFRGDATEPKRIAKAINKLLVTLPPYIRHKASNELAKDGYCFLDESESNPIWKRLKAIYNIELLSPEQEHELA